MSDDVVKTIEYKGYKILVKQDVDPCMNPREDFDNLCTMVCFHRGYNLGDSVKKHGFNRPEELVEFLKTTPTVKLALYLLDHSGITMSTGRFGCDPGGWDTSHVGYIYVTYEALKKEFGWKGVSPTCVKKAKEILEAEVETYDQYITGDVYGYEIVEPDGTDKDSCWGYFGSDHEKSGLLEAARNAVDYDITYRLKTEGIQEELVLA